MTTARRDDVAARRKRHRTEDAPPGKEDVCPRAIQRPRYEATCKCAVFVQATMRKSPVCMQTKRITKNERMHASRNARWLCAIDAYRPIIDETSFNPRIGYRPAPQERAKSRGQRECHSDAQQGQLDRRANTRKPLHPSSVSQCSIITFIVKSKKYCRLTEVEGRFAFSTSN